VEFTHGICPDCMKKLYPNYCKDDENKNETWDKIRLTYKPGLLPIF
jgi:predicted amidophosphoribosyltransferase